MTPEVRLVINISLTRPSFPVITVRLSHSRLGGRFPTQVRHFKSYAGLRQSVTDTGAPSAHLGDAAPRSPASTRRLWPLRTWSDAGYPERRAGLQTLIVSGSPRFLRFSQLPSLTPDNKTVSMYSAPSPRRRHILRRTDVTSCGSQALSTVQ